jgi:hypothetical protein
LVAVTVTVTVTVTMTVTRKACKMTIGVKAFTCEGKKGEKHNFAGDIVDIAPSLQLGRPTILLR